MSFWLVVRGFPPFFVGFLFFNETLFTPQQTVQYVNNNLKRLEKTHQVEVIELFLAKVATLCILSKDLKNFPVQLINPLSDSSCKEFAIC